MTSEYPHNPAFEPDDLDKVDSEVWALEKTAEGMNQSVTISTEKLGGRQRRILASVCVPCPLNLVWQVITDYERLADFIPNLTLSQLIDHPEGGIRLEQIGSQCFLNVKFCARVVLDMVEHFPQELQFSMVDGDFRQFEGAWRLESLSNQETKLVYDLTILPPRTIPAALIERHICRDLSQNLRALCDRAMTLTALPAD